MRAVKLPSASLLSCEQAATHVGFTVEDFEKWAALGLLPRAGANTDGWTRESLDRAINQLRCNGWAAHRELPDIQRQPRTNSLGLKTTHHYRRGVRGALKGDPGSGVYMGSLIEKNRQFARQVLLPNDPRPKKTALLAPTSPAAQRKSPPLAPRGGSRDCSSPTAHVSGQRDANPAPEGATPAATNRQPGTPPRRSLAISFEDLPLYPNEEEIALAVLGPDRAHEWKAKAIILEREGLPRIDALMGGRPKHAVERFFANRYPLDAGIPEGVKSSIARRVRVAPFAPDGTEVLNGTEETADRHRRPTRRS